MPLFNLPDNFTVSDAEFLESKQAQEAVYRDEGGRQAGYASYVDPLGHARWDTDYVTLRMAGYTHSQALQEMRVRIREAWRPSPLPATEPHVVLTPQHPPSIPNVPVPGTPTAPLDRLRAALLEADRHDPMLKVLNTIVSCGTLLQRTLAIAGPEFAFIGKTATMDGSKWIPANFVPRLVHCTRPDGQLQDVEIVGIGMDACWHLPTMKQYKVLVNSTDGEIADGGKGGPAQLTPYPIDEFKDGARQYRWHNPPIPQTF